MLDANEILKQHHQGNGDLLSLRPDESTVLQHYCSLLTDSILAAAASRSAPADQAVINGIRTGIALGLHLRVADGQLFPR